MRLTEALLAKSTLLKKVNELIEKLRNYGRVIRGTKPDEDAPQLLQELHDTEEKLADLTLKINRANSSSKMENGLTLLEGLAKKQLLKERLSHLNTVLAYTQPHRELREKTETWYDSTINRNDLRNTIKNLEKEFNTLEVEIQACNWTVNI